MVADIRAVYAQKSVSVPSSSSSKSAGASAGASASSSSESLNSRGVDQDDDNDVLELDPLLSERNPEEIRRVDRSKAMVDGHSIVSLDGRETLCLLGDGDEDNEGNEAWSRIDENLPSITVTSDMNMNMADALPAQSIVLSVSIKEIEVYEEAGGDEESAGIEGVGEMEDFGEFIGESSSFSSTLRSVRKRKMINDGEVAADTVSEPAYLCIGEEELVRELEEPRAAISGTATLADPSSDTALIEFSSPCTVKKKNLIKKQQGKSIGTEDSRKPKKARKIKKTDCIDDIFANL